MPDHYTNAETVGALLGFVITASSRPTTTAFNIMLNRLMV